MADHSKPTNTSLYSNYTAEINGRVDDAIKGLDPATSTPTNVPTNAIRWNSASSYWEKWNGSTWAALSNGYQIDLAGARKITTNSSSPALTITQTGTGNAFVVEDEASPDATPFVIDSTGRTLIGHTTSMLAGLNIPGQVQISTTSSNSSLAAARFTNDSSGATIQLIKARGTTIGTNATAAEIGDTAGLIRFAVANGSNLNSRIAQISAVVTGTPATTPTGTGDLVFSTNNGSSDVSERMRIDSAGNVLVGGTSTSLSTDGAVTPSVQNIGATASASTFAARISSANATPGGFFGFKTRGGLASPSAAISGDNTVRLQGFGYNGTTASFIPAGRIDIAVDGSPGASDMPGRITFFTTAVGASTSTERMRIDSNGQTLVTGYIRSTTDVRASQSILQTTSPTNSNTSATATASSLLAGLRTGTPAADINLTLPTGTNMDAAFSALETNMSFEWSYINLAATTHVVTILGNTDHTLVGTMTVQPATSARFLTRKTAANTFITYRIA